MGSKGSTCTSYSLRVAADIQIATPAPAPARLPLERKALPLGLISLSNRAGVVLAGQPRFLQAHDICEAGDIVYIINDLIMVSRSSRG
jgi:hypothetical protein